MKQFLIIIALFSFCSSATAEQKSRVDCPKVEELSELSIEQDREELQKELANKMVQSLYGGGAAYKQWDVDMIKPLNHLTNADASYYNMAVYHCGRKVADHSWFVRLRFANTGSKMNMLGEFFAVKDKNKKWLVWFRYL